MYLKITIDTDDEQTKYSAEGNLTKEAIVLITTIQTALDNYKESISNNKNEKLENDK